MVNCAGQLDIFIFKKMGLALSLKGSNYLTFIPNVAVK